GVHRTPRNAVKGADRRRRSALDELAVGTDDEPYAATALAVGVAGGGVTREAVERPLAGLQHLAAGRAVDGGELGRDALTGDGGAGDRCRRPRLGGVAGAGGDAVLVVGGGVEGAAVGVRHDLAQSPSGRLA